MHHFFTAPELLNEGRVSLAGAEAHHAVRVLRVKVGETITVADGTGRVVDAVVTRTADGSLQARVILTRENRPAAPALVLCQGVARKEPMDLVVQKSVEVGARVIAPFMAERTIVRWDENKRRKAVERWASIALGAAKQCRSPWPTTVLPVAVSLDELPADGVVLVLHERVSEPFRAALPSGAPARLIIVVGPEGGLTDTEVDALADRGGRAVTLGERIRRTATAGPVALALAAYTYGSLG